MPNQFEGLAKACGIRLQSVEFQPARYFPASDTLIYLSENCSYVTDRIDPILTLLDHPYEDRPVGIQIKGLRYVWNKLRLKADGFLPLVKILEQAFSELGPELVREETARRDRRLQYRTAMALVTSAQVPTPTEFATAA